MNYAGKFDGAISSEGPGSHSHFAHLNPGHVHAPADAIVVPDAHFLFNADFKRSGVDLILSGDDRELVLHDYFKGEKHKALASPDGAHLTGALVDSLTGHVEIAQAGGGTAAASAVIGHVTKLAGSATVIRNGVSIILNMGDNVEKGDVVQSGSNSTVGITFIDGTVFGLSSNAKMVLNDMVYDPNGSNNSSLLSLVAGTITFVAGETAKHGDMKIDTPVATMGIRGTAVLVEIDFSIPGANGAPNASFQVLVEPDGTTGSYILFDKSTLQPLAIINQAGQQININNGVISQTNNPLTPQMQQLITDVFNQAHADNSTTKSTTTFGSSTPDGPTATAKYADSSTLTTTTQGTSNGQADKQTSGNGPNGQGTQHVAGAPTASFSAINLVFVERPGLTGSSALDQMKLTVGFSDPNSGDSPTVRADFTGFTYKDAAGHDVALSPLAQQDVLAAEIDLNPALVAAAGNANDGSTDVLYSLADKDFDFLAAGERFTLTYVITVNNNYGPAPEVTKQTVTFTIFGTNDVPVIADDQLKQLIEFAAGTGTSGGTLIAQHGDATSGTYDFKDPDLTDTHWIIDANKDPAINKTADPNASDRFNSVHKAALTSASLTLPDGTTLDKAGLEALAPGPMSVFEQALDVDVSTDSTGTGKGQISWQLENLPVFLADFIPAGETLKLYYTIEVTDEQGATDTKIVEVDITGTNAAATVWVHTTTDGNDNNWTTGANWGTGKAPTGVNDVIIVTDQLHPNTPAYPATITTGTQAAAHSVVMNDFVAAPGQNIPPELKLEINSSLTIGTDFDLSADSILTNAGTVNVGGKLELLDDATNPVTTVNKSVITNSGTIDLAQGGDIQGLASVANTGTIELQGGTLNLDVDIANTDGVTGGNIYVDNGAKLVLGTDVNAGGVTGGTLTVEGGGELDLTRGNTLSNGILTNQSGGQVNVTGTGNTFDHETVNNNATIDVASSALLTLDNGTAINNGASGNAETVEGTLTLQDTSSITAGTVTVANTGKLNLQGTATLKNGTLTNGNQVNVTGSGNTFDHETVNNNATIDVASGALLTLDNGTAITNGASGNAETVEGTLTLQDTSSITAGTVTVSNTGKLNLQGTATLKNGTLTNGNQVNVTGSGNTFDHETVNNNAMIDVASGALLTLDNGTAITNGASGNAETVEGTLTLQDTSSITAGTVTVANTGKLNLQGTATLKNGTLTNGNQVNVTGSGNTFDHETVNNNAMIDVASGALLTLDNGTAITNGASGNAETVEGTLTLQDTSSITAGTVTVANTGKLNLQGTAALKNGTLTNGNQVNVTGTGNTLDHETVNNNATIDVASGALLTLDNGTAITNGASGNSETVEGTLTLQDTSSITAGTVTVANTGKLNLQGTATLKNGTLTNGNQVNVTGSGNTLDHETVNNNATIDIASGALLTLDNGTAITNGASGNSETVEGTLTLANATISNGTVTNKSGGTLNLQGTTRLDSGATLANQSGGQVNVSGTGNVLDNATVSNTGTASAIDITGALTLQDGTHLTNQNATSGEQIENGGSLSLSNATISNGTVTNKSGGTLALQGSGRLDSGATLTNQSGGQINVSGASNVLDNVTVSNTGTGSAIDITGALTLQDGTHLTNQNATSGEQIENGGALTLSNATISNGTVTNKSGGTLTLQGSGRLDTGAVLTNQSGGQVNVSGTGNVLDNVTVSNTGTASAIDITGALTLQDGTHVTNQNATSGETVENGASLTLNDTSSITNGKLVNLGTVNIEESTGAKLDNVIVTGGGTMHVDAGSPATLILEDGTSITAGSIEIGSVGTLEVSTGGATFAGVTIDITSGGNLQVDSNDTLTLDGTVNNGKITDNGTLAVGSGKSLKLNGVAVSNGKISNAGTIEIFSTGSIEDDVLTNTAAGVLLVDSSQILTLDGTTINNGKVTNDGTVHVGSGTLTLNSVTIAGGNVTNAGTIDSTGGVNIDDANITNTGTLESTAGLLTIDGSTSGSGPSQTFTLTNSNTVKADGGQLYIIDEQVTNTATLEAIHSGTLKLTGLTVTNTDGTHNGTVTIDGTSELDLVGANITGGQLSNSGHLYNVSGNDTISAAVTNTGTIEVQGGSLDLSGGLTGVGTLKIDSGTTLEIAGADAQTVTFTGGTGTLQLDNTSIPFTGTITGNSSGGGNFTITGAANITAGGADAIDFNAAGGTTGARGTVTISTSGTVTGAATGIAVIQNGVGDITVSPSGNVTGSAGSGIVAEDTAAGSGNITVNATGKVTGGGAVSDGILATNLNAANNGNIGVTASAGVSGGTYGIEAVTQGNGIITVEADKTIAGTAQYGIRAATYGSGNMSVTTDANAVITSGSSGINVANLASSVAAGANSAITVTTRGTINSGTTNNLSGSAASGIQAGFKGSDINQPTVANPNVNGTVTVTNYADITAAAGYGINAYNEGNGSVTVNDDAGTIIAAQTGIDANQNGGGTGDVTVTVAQGLSITGTSAIGINAVNSGSGDTTVTTADSDTITAGTQGIAALNTGTTAAHNSVQVTANGTINAATGINAGYLPGGTSAVNATVAGDVTVTSNAVIHATNGDGIDAFNYGSGDVTITTGATSAITASADGLFADAFGGGDVNVTNKGSINAGLYGIFAATVGTGDIVVGSTGGVTATGTGTIGILAENLDTSGTGDVSVTATGGVSGGLHGIQAINDGSGDVTVEAGGAIVGTSQFGVRSENYGAGDNTVTTDAGSTINSGGSGINAVNFATAIDAVALSTITVTNNAAITSGSQNNPNGTAPQGIVAGYYGALPAGTTGGVPNAQVHGTVTVNNNGNILAAVAYGIEAYNEGIGDVTINEGANTSVTAQQIGLGNFVMGGGAGDATVNLQDHVQISTTSGFGIQAYTVGSGSVAVNMTDDTDTDTINSGGSGIVAVNAAATLDAAALSGVTVNAHGTIHSGSSGTGTIAGILAGYNGLGIGNTNTPAPNLNVNGDVTVNNYADITADAGFGIDAFNFGNGDVTVNDKDGTSITAPNIGIAAASNGGGTGDVTVNVGANASVTGGQIGIAANHFIAGTGDVTVTLGDDTTVKGTTGTGITASSLANGNVSVVLGADDTVTGGQTGILAGHAAGATGDVSVTLGEDVSITAGNTGILGSMFGPGSLSVTMASGDSITSGGLGINAGGQPTSVPAGKSISVAAHGTISGTNGGINTGYYSPTLAVLPNVAGDVFVTSDATITSSAGYGILAFTYGTGNVAVTADESSSITAQGFGIQAQALDGGDITIGNDGMVSATTDIGLEAHASGGGDISITNGADGSVSGVTGLIANTDGAGNVTIENDGMLTGTVSSGINVSQNAAGATGSTTITNKGTVTGAGSNAAILVGESATGTATMTNTGTIGSATNVNAIFETGGNLVINNDSMLDHNGDVVGGGVIDGAINAATTTFTNEVGATWNAVGSSNFGASSTIGNTGTISLTSASISDAGGLTITNEADGVIDGASGSSSINGATIKNAGTIESTGGTLTIDPVVQLTLTNTGTLEAITGGTLKLTNIAVANSVTDSQSVVHNGTVLTDSASVFDLDGSSITGGFVNNAGTIYSTGTSTINAAITNGHSIEVGTGTLTLSGSISGNGSATIDGGAALELGSNFADGQNVTFAGTGGELIIDSSASLTGQILGLDLSDKIDLQGIDYASATASYNGGSGVLTVTDGNGDSVALNIGTGFGNAHFAAVADGTGVDAGTLITLKATDDAPVVAAADKTEMATASEHADTTNAAPSVTDPSPAAGGTIHFTDADLTDRSTVQSVLSVVDADGNDLTGTLTVDQINALESALIITPSAANATHNDGSVGWSYSIADNALDFLGEGQVVVVKAAVTVTDNFGQSDTAEIDVTITGANDAPVITFAPNGGGTTIDTNEDTSVAISGLSVSDPDNNAGSEQLTLHVDHGTLAVSTTTNLSGDFDGSDGSLTLTGSLADINNALATLSYQGVSNFSGTDDLHLSLDDQVPNAALTTTQDIAIGVAPVADTPTVATLTAGYSANADSTITLTGFTGVGDTDGSETLSLCLSSFPTGTTFNAGHLDQTTGNWVIDATDISGLNGASLTMTPPSDFGGSFSLHVDAKVTDTATVLGVPASDTKTFSENFSVAVDKLSANDDAVSNASPPSGDGWVFDSADGHYYRYVSTSVTYADAQAGAANDGSYLATITDSAENSFVANLPGMSSVEFGVWTGGTTHNANANSQNELDSNATWTWTSGPESGSPFTYTNWNSGEPNGGFNDTNAAMQISNASNGGGWNDVPTDAVLDGGNSFQAGYVEEWGGLSGQIAFKENTGTTIATSVLLANDTDSLGNPITVTSVGDSGHSAQGGTVTLNGNVIDYTPATGFSGQDSFTYTISDGGQTSTATATFNVAAPATSGSAAVTLGPADFNFEGHTYATGPVATTNIGNGSDGVTLVGSVNWNGEGDAGHVQVIVYNGNPSVSGSGLFGEATANGLDLQILAGGSTILDTGVTLASGQWHNLALTHENGTFTLYVDGAVAYTGDAGANGIPNPSYPNEPEAMFVAGDGGENFNGAVANVSVWNTALTQAQIQGTDFNALTGNESGLVAYYPLNDGSGTTVADVVNSAGNLQITTDGQGSGTFTSATGDVTLNIAPDNLQHQVFPFIQITGTASTIHSATVTWNVTGDGTVSSEGLVADSNGLVDGIQITAVGNSYQLTGNASVADYENVLSHLTFQTTDPQSDGTTFTVTVNDGTGDSTVVTSTIKFEDVWTNGSGDYDWNDPTASADNSNWSLGHVPGPSDYVLINGDGNAVTDDLSEFGNDQSIAQLHLMSSSSILDIESTANNQTFTISGAADAAHVALLNGGTLNIGSSSGSSSNVSVEISGGVQNNGSINVTGSSTSSVATAEFSGYVQNTGSISADGTGATVTFDAVNVDNLNGTISSSDGAEVFFNGTTVTDGQIQSDSSSTIEFDGSATLDGVYVSNDGTVQVDPVVQQTTTLTLDDDATIDGGELVIGSTGVLEIAGGASGSGATLDDGIVVTNDNLIQVDASSVLTLDDATINGGSVTVDGTINVTGSSMIGAGDGPATLQNDSGGTIDAIDSTLTLNTGNVITNAGLLEATSGGTLDVQDSEIHNTGTGTKGIVIDGASSTLLVDTGTLKLSGGGEVLLTNGGTIAGQAGDEPVTLDNVDNAIHTAEFSSGAIGNGDGSLILINEAGGSIITNLPYSPLTIDTGNTITNAGTLEAGPNGGLTIDDNVDNSGLVEAISGQLDVTAGSITWTGATPVAGTNGIVINLGGSLLIDSDALTLDGGGAVSLLNGYIDGTTAGEGATLTNADSIIGYGQINVGLINHGMIDASGSGQTLLIDTGGSAVDNTGTLSADGNATLQINDFLNDSGTLKASGGGIIDLAGGGSSSGLIDIENGTLDVNSDYSLAGHATLHVAGDVFIGTDAGESLSFAAGSNAMIELDGGTIHGAVAGFASGDAIDFAGISSNENPQLNYDNGTGVLTLNYVANGTPEHESITLSGNYTQSDFVLVQDQNGGTDVLYRPDASVTVLTPDGLNFQTNPNPLTEMGSGTIEPSGSMFTFTIDATSSNKFVVDGYGFSYDGNNDVTGGTITAIHEFDANGNPVANFTGPFDAASWMADVKDAAGGDFSELNALVSSYNFTFNGGSGPDSFGSAGRSETINGGGGNDTLDPGPANGGVHTLSGGSGSDTFIYQAGYGAVTIIDVDQGNNGQFDASEGDQILLNGFSGQPNVTYDSANNITTADFGGGDVLTLLGISPDQIQAANVVQDGSGNNNGGGGGNNGGPVIGNANNAVTYTGTPLFVDQSVAVTDTTGTVTSVNVWISSGYQTGDELTIDGNVDGQIVNPNDGSIIHYHFDPSANNNNNGIPAGGIYLYGASGTPTTADFQAALEMIQFTPGAGGGDRTVTWAAQDGNNSSPTETTTVHIDAPVVITNNMALVTQNSFGGAGEHQGAAVDFAVGRLYLSYNNGPQNQNTSDSAEIVAFNTAPGGATQTFSYAWGDGDILGVAADASHIYAAGESSPYFGLTTDGIGDKEAKSIFVSFDADGTAGSDPPPALGYTTETFYPSYQGVEIYQNILATTQGGNTVLYAFGFGQPNSYSGYIIGEYSSSGALLASAEDQGGVPGGSDINGAADWQGAIWAAGYSQHGSEAYGSPTVWTFSYNLSSVTAHEDNIGFSGSFNAVTTIGSALYAAGSANPVSQQSDFLIAKYNTDGSVAWSETFGNGNGDTLNGAVALNGHLYVVGSETVSGVTEGVLMEIDPSNGSVISTTLYDPAQYNNFTSITTDGHYLYVAGVSGSSASQDQAVLLTYDPGGATAQAVEDTALTLSSLSVSDPAAGSAQIEVTLAAGHGTIALESIAGLDSVQGAGTGSVELFGSQAAINAALAHGVVYDPTLGYVGSDTLSVTANDQGHNASNSPHSTIQDISISVAPAADTIGDGGNLLINSPSGDTVVFATGHGTLELNQPSTFTGVIAGISGTGNVLDSDVLDMHGFHYGTTTATTVGGFDFTTDTTTLTVHDSNGNVTETFKLAGDYSTSTWTVTDDNNGGVDIVDPPASSGHPLTGMILNTPDSAASEPTVIADGASAEINGPSSETVTFTGATGSLVIDDPVDFTGHIAGFTGTAPDAEHSDTIDLAGIDFNSAQFTESYNGKTGSLSVSDGSHSANFSFDNFKATLNFASDGNGGTLITDPPAPASGTPQNPIGALLHDLDPNGCFVFNPSGPAHQVLQHVFEEISDILAPLKDLVPLTGQLNASSPTSPYTPPIGGVGVDLAAWHDSLKPLLSHTDFHL